MKIFKKIVIGYVFYASPLALLGLFIGEYTWINGPLDILLLSHSLFWILTSLILTMSMFFSKNNRDVVLKKLSGIKEKDEREVQITGKALKSSYLSSMTILLFLLLISLFEVEAVRKSADNVEPGQLRGSISLHIGFKVLNSDAIIIQKEGYDWKILIEDLAISSSTLITILLVWQIVSYRYVSKRSFKLPHCPRTD